MRDFFYNHPWLVYFGVIGGLLAIAIWAIIKGERKAKDSERKKKQK